MHQGENALLNESPSEKLRSDILFAPHHGSKSSSSSQFIEAIAPEIAIVSAGWQNPFGFPSQEVLDRYQRLKITTIRTDQCGAIEIIFDDRNFHINTMLSCAKK